MNEIPLSNAWLQQVGFKLGNPFSTREAAREPESALVRYFVPHPSFDDILGSASHPRSSLLIANRGCGKTTSMKAIEWRCRAGRMDGPVLAIPYTEFTVPLRNADKNGRVPASQHIISILRQATPLLMEVLFEQPDRVGGFIGGLLNELATYLDHFTDLLTDRGLDLWLHQKHLLSQEINTGKLRTVRPATLEHPFLQFLSSLLAIQPKPWNPELLAPVKLLASFVDLANVAGFGVVYILVDRLDERPPMSSNPERAADLLEHLVANLPLMELKDTAFKLFLTPAIMASLQQRSGIRLDRLLIRYISWNEQELQHMLDRRVEVFTEGTLPSLDAVSEPMNLVGQMAAHAQSSPRNMLRLAEWTLYWHHINSGNQEPFLLTQGDFDQALNSFLQEQDSLHNSENHPQVKIAETEQTNAQHGATDVPLLWIDEGGNVWGGETRLKRLPKKQHRLLACLLENSGRICSYDTLIYAVHRDEVVLTEGVTNQSIDKLVQRLRKRIGNRPDGRPFIVKAPTGDGYVLDLLPNESFLA